MSKPAWGSQYDDVDVLCPFYIASNRQSKIIVCEGALERTKTTLRFSRREEMREHVEGRCQDDYKNCPYYIATNAKYEDADN